MSIYLPAHAVISYSFIGKGGHSYQNLETVQTLSFFPSMLWLFVKQHNSGFVPAIWSTVIYSWPVDAMPTTASKRSTLCWRIMDIYSSGILFTIFSKIDVCTKVMWWTLVHILSFKITKGDECHYSLLRHVKDGILWKKNLGALNFFILNLKFKM